MSWVYIGATAVSVGLQVKGQNEQKKALKAGSKAEQEAARRAEEAAEFAAMQFGDKAEQERAFGSMAVEDESAQRKAVISNTRAIGAASGAGGYESNIADIKGESDYRMLAALYNSEQSARDFEISAEVARREGADAARAHIASAGAYRGQAKAISYQGSADLINQGVTLYERYGNQTGKA
jgi:hypothetical protein